ncbi:MAG: FemAB family PEP-CTERM system-associated protein [Candidatus Obscuribacterales bacterium]|nr:FemAB family PEP-CTERM system-associated protein [Steroidobacteraceae bacterium]
MPIAANTAPTPVSIESSSNVLSVEVCEPTNRSAWDSFVGTHPHGSFYHLYGWKSVNEQALGHQSIYLMARDANSVRGVLPLVFVRSRLFGRILCSMPFVNFGGPCATDPPTYNLLMQAATTKANELRADYVELRSAEPVTTSLPVSLRKISMTLDLQSDPDKVWDAFSSKHRTAIRRSYKNDLEVYSGGAELLPIFYKVMQNSWQSLGTPLYALSYFERIMATFGEDARIFVCHRKQEPVAVAFNGHANETVEGMWAGGNPLARSLQANYVLYWEMIKDGCLRGYKKYHLGRSTADSAGEDFKKKWNATSKQLHWYFHRPDGGPMPELNVDNPKYKLAIAAWQRLPMWATGLLGPPIARLIP